MFMSFISKKKLTVEIEIIRVVYLITLYYSIYFFGAYPNNLNINPINLFLILSPSIILFVLSKTIKHERIKVSIEIKSILFTLIAFLTFIFVHTYSENLLGDEIHYAYKTLRFPIETINILKEKFNFVILDSKSFIRLFSLIFILFSTLFIKSDYFHKLFNFSLVIILLLRVLIWSYSGGIAYVHPPLSSFLSSLLIIPFGINDITFKISTCLFFFTLTLFLFNYIKSSLRNQLLFYALLIFFPIIGNNLLIFEQSTYFSLFLFLIIVLINKISISQVSIIIGISLLFRQTAIIFIFIPFILSLMNWVSFRKFFYDLSGILIGAPVFVKGLILGTPTTPNPTSLLDTVLSINFNLIDFLDIKYAIYAILLITLLLYRKEYKKIFFLLSTSLFFIIIFRITKQSFENKYVFEFFGALLLLFIFLLSTIKSYTKIILSFFLILFINYNFKYEYIYKDNSFTEILNLMGQNTSETLFIRGDYYYFSRLIKNKSLSDTDYKFEKEYKKILKLNGKENINLPRPFNLKQFLSYNYFPNYIVFMESRFHKLDLVEKSEILKYYKIEYVKEETSNSYEYLILKLI